MDRALPPHTYCALEPTPKQQQFLDADSTLEVFFGGAAGGGKSAALLMGALSYVHHAGYAALIIRKDLPRLCLAGGLIPRAHEWFAGTKAKWNQARRQWQFPIDGGPPATLTFGYLARPLDKYRYASSEFQYIAFDELTDFHEDDYRFLFSRLRRVRQLAVPLRMRSASNPGGPGHAWVKARFIESSEVTVQGQVTRVQISEKEIPAEPCPLIPEPCFQAPERALLAEPRTLPSLTRLYIPSRIADNPALDEQEYCDTLGHLPAVTRERLMNGDWSVQERSLIRADWLRYYIEVGEQLELLDALGRTFQTVPAEACQRFATIDPAGTSADLTAESRGRPPSFSVIQIWDRPPRELDKFLLLRHQVRVQVGFEKLCQLIEQTFATWQPDRIWIEDEKLGKAAVDLLRRRLPIECVKTAGRDKATRAARLIIKFERGEVYLPKNESSWRPGLEAEFLAWTGTTGEVADQIDAAAYAAIVADGGLPHVIRINPIVVSY